MAVRQRCVDESHSVYTADVQESPFSWGACWPGEWLAVDSNGMDGKPTFHRRPNLSWFSKICNHFREIAAWSRKSLTMITVFLKRPLKGKFSKNYSERIHHITEPRLACKFRQIWLTGNRQSCALFTWQKNKTSARSPALASVRITPKICHGQLQTTYSEFQKFHPNPFTSSGVIAERLNIVETCHKVFPILGEASSPSNDTPRSKSENDFCRFRHVIWLVTQCFKLLSFLCIYICIFL